MKKREILQLGGGEVVGKCTPDYERLPDLINEDRIGPVKEADSGEQRKVMDRGEGMELMREYAFTINPITARTRAVSVLMKLEEKALGGNVKAATQFLDRTVGKVTQTIAIGHTRFSSMSDAELMEIVEKKAVKKKV